MLMSFQSAGHIAVQNHVTLWEFHIRAMTKSGSQTAHEGWYSFPLGIIETRPRGRSWKFCTTRLPHMYVRKKDNLNGFSNRDFKDVLLSVLNVFFNLIHMIFEIRTKLFSSVFDSDPFVWHKKSRETAESAR